MFNINHSGLLTFLILTYLTQTWILLLFLAVIGNPVNSTLTSVNTQLSNRLLNFSLYCLIFFFAGVPPFFMFFVKILVFVKFSDSNLIFIALFVLNTIILSYYLNFIYKLTESRRMHYQNIRFTIQTKIRSSFTHMLFINLFSVFLIYPLYFV